jgi:predicted transcriptional regulator of viral defense system
MYKDTLIINERLKDYASPRAKLTRMIKSGQLIQVKRGFFLDPKEGYLPESLAGIIYGPSYISFEYALSYYGLIPEKVNTITSAAYNKNKNKNFHTPIGNFYYYYLPVKVYPYYITRVGAKNSSGADEYSYLIASPEKALCDTLYKIQPITSVRNLEYLLFDDLRIEKEDILKLDTEAILFLAPRYRKNTLSIFVKWLTGESNHG